MFLGSVRSKQEEADASIGFGNMVALSSFSLFRLTLVQSPAAGRLLGSPVAGRT